MTRIITLILLGLLIHATPTDAAASSLRTDIAAALEEEGLVGAAWATLEPDGLITTGAAGLKDAHKGTLLAPTDRVQIGSVAKTFLAVGILRLVSEGRLRLDTPVSALLPDVRFDNPWAATDPVRVRHLLDHTSGLDDARLWQVFSLNASPDTPLRASFAGSADLMRIRQRPGSTHSYSNMGYTLAARVIEAVTGERYETYLERQLLIPLRMTDSSFRFVTQAGPNGDPRLAMGHFETGTPHRAVPQYLRPAGQFTTTAHDMALFARFLLGNGNIEGKPFIDEALLRAMGHPSDTDAAMAGLKAGYGLGLRWYDRNGVTGLCHGGSTVGYRAMFCLYPDERKAFFIALNADSETADHQRFNALLAHALKLHSPKATPPAAFPDAISSWQGIYVPSPSRLETFAYLDHVFNFAVLERAGERLWLSPFQAAAKELVPVGGALFRAQDRIAPSHVLLTTRDGGYVISDGFQSYKRVSLWCIGLLWVSLTVGVLSLCYILLAGLVQAARRALARTQPLFFPWLAVLALLLPVPLFLHQSFLQLGDLTPASAALALVTCLLPLALIYGLVRRFRIGITAWPAWVEAIAMLGALQWMTVLMGWGVLPLRLWT